jgi:arginine deiminase
MVPLEKNTRVIDMLRGAGFEVLTPDIKELVGGYGAVHCMTASIVRG